MLGLVALRFWGDGAGGGSLAENGAGAAFDAFAAGLVLRSGHGSTLIFQSIPLRRAEMREKTYTDSILMRRLGQILAIILLLTCFVRLTAESRWACFSPDPTQRQLTESTKLMECRAVNTVPHIEVIPLPIPAPAIVLEAMPVLEEAPPPVSFVSPANFFRPPPIV